MQRLRRRNPARNSMNISINLIPIKTTRFHRMNILITGELAGTVEVKMSIRLISAWLMMGFIAISVSGCALVGTAISAAAAYGIYQATKK